MASKHVTIPSIGEVRLSKRRGNSNIRLSFDKNGAVRVSMPFWVPYEAGIQFALARTDWIAKHQPATKILLQASDRIGKSHRLHFTFDETITKPAVRTTDLAITVRIPATMHTHNPIAQSAAERGAVKALKKQADALLPDRLRNLAERHNFEFATMSTKRLHSRWGSCDTTKHITLNIYLMQLPWHLIDYVLLHELVHTEHLDHSEAFWNRFLSILPNAKLIRRELKTHQTVLTPVSTIELV